MEERVNRELVERLKQKPPSEIVREMTESEERTKLFNEEALKKIKESLEKWKEALPEEDKKNFTKTVYTLLGVNERIPRALVYTPLDVAEIDYLVDIGLPGEEPFVRGIHPNMYRGRRFTIRPIVGFGTPEDTNKRIKFLLKSGATGINIVFDLPTIQEFDCDDPYAKGQVGLCGVSVCTVEDWKRLLEGVDLCNLSLSITTHYPSNTMILTSMFLVAAEEMGYDWSELRGTSQNDLIMEAVVRTSPISLPPRAIFKLQVDNIEFLRKNVPKWNYSTFNGYNLREAGVDRITEMAVALSNAFETALEMMKRGYHPDEFLDRAAFFWDICNDFFVEITSMRAVRKIWYKLIKALGARKSRSYWCRFHVQTSGYSLTREEPLNNIIRGTIHALIAVFGGAQSLHVSAYDEAYSVPTEESHLISVRTQQIIQEETGVTEVVDPLAGSYYVEWLTSVLQRKILEEMDEIWRLGGIVRAIESGWLHKKIAENNWREEDLIEKGIIKIVGVNIYKSDAKLPPIDVFRYPEGVEEEQRRALEEVKRSRNNDAVQDKLEKIVEAAQKGENLFPYVLEAARERATLGEIAKTLIRAYGVWKPVFTF